MEAEDGVAMGDADVGHGVIRVHVDRPPEVLGPSPQPFFSSFAPRLFQGPNGRHFEAGRGSFPPGAPFSLSARSFPRTSS